MRKNSRLCVATRSFRLPGLQPAAAHGALDNVAMPSWATRACRRTSASAAHAKRWRRWAWANASAYRPSEIVRRPAATRCDCARADRPTRRSPARRRTHRRALDSTGRARKSSRAVQAPARRRPHRGSITAAMRMSRRMRIARMSCAMGSCTKRGTRDRDPVSEEAESVGYPGPGPRVPGPRGTP